MAQIVEYILNLKDDLSKGLEGANVKANALEGTLKNIGSVIGVLGVSMAAFAGFEALKGSHEVWEKMEFSISQVEAGLKSTKNAAGLTFEDIEKSAYSASRGVKFAQEEILGMQSVLLTFPSVTKESFGPATDIILDMSTRLGQDLKSSAIQVGKALQDPIKGVTALRRVGVNFNETQTETIKHLAETNRLAEAQALIMKELNLEFSGSASSAFNADASAQYELSLHDIRLEVGKLVDDLQKELMPAALEFLKWIKVSVDWISKNTGAIWSMIKGMGAAWLSFKVGTSLILPLVSGLYSVAPAAASAALGVETVGAAATLSLGPLGLLAAAIGGVVFAYDRLATAEKNLQDNRTKIINQAAIDEQKLDQDNIDKFVKMGMDRTVATEKEIASRKEYIESNLSNLRIHKDVTGHSSDDDREDFEFQKNIWKSKLDAVGKTNLIPKKENMLGGGTSTGSAVKSDNKLKATGSKSVTINVSIKDLIGTQNINTTNIKEGAGKIKEMVVAALAGAVNDFQIVAGE